STRSYGWSPDGRPVIRGLAGLRPAIAAGRRAAEGPPMVSVVPRPEATTVTVGDVEVNLPSGAPLVAAHDIVLPPAEAVLVTGPTGSGKSTLFRAIAGVWPFGRGTVTVPAGASVVVLPPRPH